MKTNRSPKCIAVLTESAPAEAPVAAPSPIVRHLLDGVVRRAARGDREALATVTRELRPRMVAHAEEHLARLDADAEDVVQSVLLALLDRSLPAPRRGVCAVEWLLGQVALFAQPDLVA